MLFPTHLVAAYLLGRQWRRSIPLVVLGAALPDLVDKPLGMLGVTDLYHSVGHSLFALVAVSLLASQSRVLVPLCLGWGSHLVLDAVHMVLNGRPVDVQFLAWPVIRHTPAVDLPPVAFAVQYVGTPSFFVEVVIWVVFGVVLVTSRRVFDGGRRPR
jgi:hypothetical protein